MKISFSCFSGCLLLIISFFSPSYAFAAERVVNLVIAYKTVHLGCKPVRAIAVNNQIPAPTLHFKRGDHVTINVYNCLDKGTVIHWHGVLVPWQMDGVKGVAQREILPGGVFRYQFTLEQAGTYWYHAHAGLQEQQGFYGAFLIDPLVPPHYKYTKDYVVVLSDWSDTRPEQIFANLKKNGAYYTPRMPLQASLVRFLNDYNKANPQERKKLVNDYTMMQRMRMGIYDMSDIAYDAFLLNGCPSSCPWKGLVEAGDVVRLRFIGASGSTNYHVKIPGAKMQIIHIQGNDVKPYAVEDFWITPGETYDVLVKIQKNEPAIIYAESDDTLGAAYGALVTSSHQYVDYKRVAPFPEPIPITREIIANQMEKEHEMEKEHAAHLDEKKRDIMHATRENRTHFMHKEMSNDHAMVMDMPTEPSIKCDRINSAILPGKLSELTTGTKYQALTAAVKTNDPNKPVKIIRMELFGYMERFIWMINGLPEYKAVPLLIEPGERYRIIFTNHSMMHHPMHMHGHWFILRNGHGAYDPLLHTIDVPPGATVVADVDADASGQWFFHCHNLYHMAAGMARILQYGTIREVEKGVTEPEKEIRQQSYLNRPIVRVDEQLPLDACLIHCPMAHPPGFYAGTFLDVGVDPFHNAQKITFKGLYGGDSNKLELFANDAEAEEGKVEEMDVDIFYWRLISQFWAIKGGVNYFYRPASTPYWQPGIGIEGLMPYFIDTDIRTYYHNNSVKFDIELSRDTQITNNFFIRAGVRSILATKTVVEAGIGSGLNQMRYILRPYYRLAPGLSVFAEYEYEKGYGAFAHILQEEGDPTTETTVTLGFSFLF